MSSPFGNPDQNKNRLLMIAQRIYSVNQELENLKVTKKKKKQELAELVIDHNYYSLRLAHVLSLVKTDEKIQPAPTPSPAPSSGISRCEDTEGRIIYQNEETSDEDELSSSVVETKPVIKFLRKKIFVTEDKRVVESKAVIHKSKFDDERKKNCEYEKVFSNTVHVGWTESLKRI